MIPLEAVTWFATLLGLILFGIVGVAWWSGHE